MSEDVALVGAHGLQHPPSDALGIDGRDHLRRPRCWRLRRTAVLGLAGASRLAEAGLDEARTEDSDIDPLWGELAGPAFRHGNHREFGSAVWLSPGRRDHSRHRSRVDEATALAMRSDQRQKGFHPIDHPHDVDRDDPVPIGGPHLVDRSADADPGIVAHYMDFPEGSHGLSRRGLNCGAIADVANHSRYFDLA